MKDGDVISAWFVPGFSVDLTNWRVFIDRNCRLRQEVVITIFKDPDKNEVLRYAARLSRKETAQLWSIIERIGFHEFERKYTHEKFIVTDCESYWIKVRFGDRTKEVEVYDPYRLANFEKNQAAIGFLELWDAIHQYTPHGKVPVEAGRPKPWWRIW